MDNNKVFFAGWYTFACCAVAQFYVILFSRGTFIKIVLILIGVGFTFTSYVSIKKFILYPFPMFSEDEMNFGIWVMQNTRPNDVFFTPPFFSNAAMSYAGRLSTMGYAGWVVSHGLDLNKRMALMHQMTRNPEDKKLFVENGIRYAVAKADDDTAAGIVFPEPVGNSHWMKIIEFNTHKVYRLLDTLF